MPAIRRSTSAVMVAWACTRTNPNITSTQAAKTPDAASVQRNVVVRMKSGRRTENESFATDVLYHRRVVAAVDLAAQPAHVHVDEIALWDDLVVPDFLEQHRARQQLVLA